MQVNSCTKMFDTLFNFIAKICNLNELECISYVDILVLLHVCTLLFYISLNIASSYCTITLFPYTKIPFKYHEWYLNGPRTNYGQGYLNGISLLFFMIFWILCTVQWY